MFTNFLAQAYLIQLSIDYNKKFFYIGLEPAA